MRWGGAAAVALPHNRSRAFSAWKRVGRGVARGSAGGQAGSFVRVCLSSSRPRAPEEPGGEPQGAAATHLSKTSGSPGDPLRLSPVGASGNALTHFARSSKSSAPKRRPKSERKFSADFCVLRSTHPTIGKEISPHAALVVPHRRGTSGGERISASAKGGHEPPATSRSGFACCAGLPSPPRDGSPRAFWDGGSQRGARPNEQAPRRIARGSAAR